ncbi:MAG TPA: protein translocase subunit SecDF [Chitinophagaceae bacterium]|nr:protein translocase subunit SecDF [Chitinophagaceae bacterium]
MQLKGLVRFFTIVLIVVSLYQLSFTWFIKSHEKKMEARALSYVKTLYPQAAKYSSAAQLPDSLSKIYNDRLKRLLDSTKDVTVTYGPTGKISYEKAKENELNLGLDLQGGMNVTLEVEMSGLLRALSNNSHDPAFLQALQNADKRKANSNADFISLFVDEYKKINPNGRLASIFASANKETININDNDSKVENALRKEANDAFDRTFKVLTTRIDQFGVAQPSINPDKQRGIITVELPGIQDKERVRKYLQSSANLQFWELYGIDELVKNGSLQKADDAFFAMMGGKVKSADTTGKSADTTAKKQDLAKKNVDTAKNKTAKASDTSHNLSTQLSQITAKDTGTSQQQTTANTAADDSKKHLSNYIQFSVDQSGRPIDNGIIGYVKETDTSLVRSYLESPSIRIQFPSDLYFMYGIPENDQEKKAGILPLYGIKTYGRDKAKLEGDAITNAGQDYDQLTGKVEVTMSMNPTGSRVWADMTGQNKGKFIAIALDNVIYSAPRVNDKIEGGRSSIEGNFTEQEAQDLANILKSGKLPAPAKIVAEQQVGPTLGKEAINGGMKAFAISFIVIFLLMLIYYNSSGWIANIALVLNLLFTVGVLSALHATLTAPGIAGLVLTIGMAVDTNVIIYERIKEELTRGKGYIPAINEGYKRSLPPVLDAHVTVLMTAIILFYFGLGPVKGFATTQILGILLSLFCGILVSRWVTDWFTSKKRHLQYFTGVSRKIFQHANIKFIQYRKIAYVISVVVLVMGIASFFNGFDEGVEFKGGRSYTVGFSEPAKVEQIRDDLKKTFDNESPIIKTVGDTKTLDITTAYLIDSTGQDVDSIVERKLMTELKNYNATGILGSKKILPTISDDLKKGAVKATIFALLIIFLYIFIRFRDWRYSLGTIVSLLHDVLVTLAVFSFAREIVPFPLEIDQHFIAAVLTVIGFSMNDTVIVFDRIREYAREMRGVDKATIINRAVNDTLSRTIMTSLTVFLTILILFLVGGEVTRGFAFAMLVGVITGTYSSVFVAAPILVDLAKKRPLGVADAGMDDKKKTTAKPATAKS